VGRVDTNLIIQHVLGDCPGIGIHHILRDRQKLEFGLCLVNANVFEDQNRVVRARQSARIAIEITQPFEWPREDDPAYDDKLRGFVKERLSNVGEFVLFDEASRRQLDLPSAWDELQDSARASY